MSQPRTPTTGRSTGRRPRRLLAALAAAAAAVALPLAAPATAHAAVPGSPNDRLVTAWYEDVLGRSGAAAAQDVVGRAVWVDRLDRGERREDVLRAITRTPEYADRFVGATYGNYLGRGPDRGAQVWVRGLQSGMAPEWVEQNVLASPEWARERPGREDYVSLLYRNVLDRAPRAGERTFWQERRRQVGDLGLVREIWYTPEALVVRTDRSYLQLLGRSTAGDPAAAAWYPPMAASRLEAQIAIASTAEYAALAR